MSWANLNKFRKQRLTLCPVYMQKKNYLINFMHNDELTSRVQFLDHYYPSKNDRNPKIKTIENDDCVVEGCSKL